jgi:hypothetical protein
MSKRPKCVFHLPGMPRLRRPVVTTVLRSNPASHAQRYQLCCKRAGGVFPRLKRFSSSNREAMYSSSSFGRFKIERGHVSMAVDGVVAA